VLAEHGAVCVEVAEQMAAGVRERLGATYGVATTGEAGPDSASGQPVGTVFVAVAGPRGIIARRLEVDGTRGEVQQAAVRAALGILSSVRGGDAEGARHDRAVPPP
jgi:nicotinamide-nucleotide amidase